MSLIFLLAAKAALAASPDKALYQAAPSMSSFRAIPYVLLVLSKDMKMFQQAYNELMDMDGDDRIDTGFNPKVDYYGYFDSLSCYRYEGRVDRYGDAKGYFVRSGPTMEDEPQVALNWIRTRNLGSDLVPAARSKSGICQRSHASQGGYFSGNWLNYLVTSRMDVIRKILYGGFRYKDTEKETWLEPSLVPRDANSWGTDVLSDERWEKETPMTQYYDISKFTPFPKPTGKKAHFFARVRNTGGWGTYQVFEYYLNADRKSFGRATQITGDDGRYFDWVLQDGPNPSSNRLANQGNLRAYGLKIKVCDQGNVGEGEDCRMYPRGNLKPVGLLQKNGESGDMYFGLISGSYHEETRIKGGVLRNHIDHIKESVDMENFGQLKKGGLIWTINSFRIGGGNEGTGLQAYNNSSSWGNPIGEMLFEGVRYMARVAQPKTGPPMRPTPDFLPNREVNYNPSGIASYFKNWDKTPRLSGEACGKPIILLISEVDSEYDGDNGVNAANDLRMSALSGIGPSDAKNLKQFDLRRYLSRITDLEGFNDGRLFFFASGRLDECKPKSIISLENVNGICPYRTSYEGTYSAAAVAYFARTHNFGLGGRESPLDLYTVTMSAAFPSLEFKLKGRDGSELGKISILPASMSNTSAKNTKGRILSFLNYYILEWWVDRNGMPYHVKIKVNYEDSAQGYNPDFGVWPRTDWDMDVMIEYTIDLLTTSSPNADPEKLDFKKVNRSSGALKKTGKIYSKFREQGKNPFAIDYSEVAGLSIKMWKMNNSTSEKMALGYSINGTTHDGTYMDLGHCGGIATYATPPTCDWPSGYGKRAFVDEGTQCRKASGECPGWNKAENPKFATIRTFEFNPDHKATGEYLPNPVYLAAKYGGFIDGNNNGAPDVGEWEGKDGLPRNYFQSNNISELPNKLEAAFQDISQSISAASSTATSVNTILGGGLSVQTAFYPRYTGSKNRLVSVNWVGTVYGFFVDKFGNLREDTNQNHRLDLKSSSGQGTGDYVVAFNSLRSPPVNKPKCFSPGKQIAICADEKGDGELTPVAVGANRVKSIHGLRPVWDAGRWLSELKDPSVRNIYYVDPDNNAKATPFVDDAATVARLKNVMVHDNTVNFLNSRPGSATKPSVEETASQLIRFIRGEEIPNWRSRVVDNPWDGEATKIVWRMGDTINSKPVVVGQPAFNYEHLYGDASYAAYKVAKASRRQVAYVGSNDGFLRAINLGYRTSAAEGTVSYDPGGHDLGAELWALIPWAALPHLQWLADPGYFHAYYVDLKPVVADVKIDGQWRTILVCGMRLGGRPIEAPDSTPKNPKFFYSEVFALDVTDPNPKVPPKVLWRYGSEEMGLSVGLPAVVTSGGKWYAIVASGPAMDHLDPVSGQMTFGNFSPYEGNSDQKARLIVLEAATGKLAAPANYINFRVTEKNSFLNDPYMPLPLKKNKAGVWNDEAVYYGFTVSRDKQGIDKGGVYRLQMVDEKGEPLQVVQWRLRLLASVDRPVSASVNSVRDSYGNVWVVFGTGRLWGLGDMSPCSRNYTVQCLENHEHYLYGIKEELKNGLMTFATQGTNKLLDVSKYEVYKNGMVVGYTSVPGLNWPSGALIPYKNVFNALRGPNFNGYKRKLNMSLILDGHQGPEIVITQPQITNVGTEKSILGFTTYDLSAQSCGDFGKGYMYLLDSFTGLPAPHLISSFKPRSGSNGPGLVSGGISTGFGQPTGAVFINLDGKVLVRSSTSENSLYDVEVASESRFYKNLITWREVLNTGFTLPEDVMTEKLD
ncbi:MAG: hypothetical protein LBE01_01155 [Deltaproteobacteria bacterium]|nr:hypothetical protein [Deltaproteobacteria bacterium]